MPDPTNFKDCTGPPTNSYLPPTREVRAVVEGAWTPGGPQTTYANGIIAGQYHAPMADYRFPENLPGQPVVENNFNSIPFLAAGGYTSSTGTLVKVLDPWPSSTPPPPPPCTVAPVAVTGGPYTASSGGSITLNGSAVTTDTPVTFLWTAAAGSFSNPNVANPVYTAPTVGALTNVGLTLTVTTCGGTGVSGTIVAVNGASAPTVNHVPPLTLFSGAAGSLAVTGSDPNVPAAVPLFFAATQAGAPALTNFTVTQGPNPPGTSATITFNAPVLPLGQVTTSTVNLTITATNTANLVSAPEFTSVTVQPLPDVISAYFGAIPGQQQATDHYREFVGGQPERGLETAVLCDDHGKRLQPRSGSWRSRKSRSPTTVAGVYTLTLNGVPEPACGNPDG